MNNILFLHSQLSGYFLSSLLYAIEKDENFIFHIVASPNTSDAPFEFKTFHDRIKVYNFYDFKKSALKKLVEQIAPTAIFFSGWSELSYLWIAKIYRHKIPLIIAVDNPWYGNLRQFIALILSRLFLLKLFDFIWVPGQPQAVYAKKLGFQDSQILRNYYCANINQFNNYYTETKHIKEMKFPHKFLFVGRYVKEKGLSDLWKAFETLQLEYPNDWELVCVGTGALYESRKESKKIIHRGFVQPEDFNQIISETGVFILPSWEEHWGVVLHEYSAAGYPLVCSDEVGAASAFLHDQKNGFAFKTRDVNSLKNKMQKIVQMSDQELIQMGQQSILISNSITHEIWYESFKISIKGI